MYSPTEILAHYDTFPTISDCRNMLHRSWGVAYIGIFLGALYLIFPNIMYMIDPYRYMIFILAWGLSQSIFLEAILYMRLHPVNNQYWFTNPT